MRTWNHEWMAQKFKRWQTVDKTLFAVSDLVKAARDLHHYYLATGKREFRTLAYFLMFKAHEIKRDRVFFNNYPE